MDSGSISDSTLAITLSTGHRAKGLRVHLDPDEPDTDLANILERHVGRNAWWSGHVYREDYREGARWQAASCIPVDLDYYDEAGRHAPLPDDAVATWPPSPLPGSLCHPTPRGVRTIFVLGRPITDPAIYVRAWRAAAARALRALEGWCPGLRIDEAHDLARSMYAPRATVNGHTRTADVLLCGQPFDADALAAEAPPETERTHAPGVRSAVPDLGGAPILADRNIALTSLAGALRHRGAGRDEILEALRAANARRCTPPLPDAEVVGIANSAARYSARNEQSAEPSARALPWHTAADPETAHSEIPWRVEPMAADGSLTLLSGPAKRAGKTTLLLSGAVRAVLDGTDFLGHPVRKSPVVYLTEEGTTPFNRALHRAGLIGRDDLIYLRRNEVAGRKWADVVALAVAKAKEVGAGLLIIDTLSPWAGVPADRENDPGAANAAMDPLLKAAGTGLAVIAVCHNRKSGGDVGEAIRGSTAYAAAADHIIDLRPDKERRRLMQITGRLLDEPTDIVIELTGAGYVAKGDRAAVAKQERAASVEAAVTALVAAAPADPAKAIPESELAEACEGVARSVFRDALKAALASGQITRLKAPPESGKGRRPWLYHRPEVANSPPSDPPAETPPAAEIGSSESAAIQVVSDTLPNFTPLLEPTEKEQRRELDSVVDVRPMMPCVTVTETPKGTP